jgi:hypothetical protein
MEILHLLDIISQVLICFIGLSAIFMLSVYKNKWGNVVGLLQQPFWFYTTLYHGQWGLFFMSIAYAVVWCVGIYQWFWKNDGKEGG